MPQLDQAEFTLAAFPGVTLGGGMIPQGNVAVEPLLLLGGPVGLFLPVLNHRLALETIVAIPKRPKIVASGTLANESVLPTVLGSPTGIPPVGREIATLSAIPPLFTVVYHAPSIGPITPILGLGIIALLAANVEITSPALKQYISFELDSPPSIAPLAQVGADIRLWGRMQARIDIKYTSLSPQFKVKHILVKTGQLVGTIDLGDADIRGTSHAWLVHAGVGLDL